MVRLFICPARRDDRATCMYAPYPALKCFGKRVWLMHRLENAHTAYVLHFRPSNSVVRPCYQAQVHNCMCSHGYCGTASLH
ncbi:hypothetical protein KP509_31G056200 [Ceratopteris richardii]|uniref:Uncharacterized protein n=1 Tax=Ceratopteris richardii TaxID=49495 RepID=A0A8T2QY63_CERRI|nr:hypothetical protein KP509_31G056200 [Ceratopteris richardii]